jgi:uncharacterized protein YlxW (UPF0749 family)
MTKYENIIKKKDNRDPLDLSHQLGELQCENEGLKNKIADFEETLKSRDYTRQHDYQFLIDENRRLEEERNMLIVDNKRLAHQIDDQVSLLRKAGVL